MSNNTWITNITSIYNETEFTVYISNAQLRVVTIVLALVCIPSFCLLGSIGNGFSLAILINERMRNQTNSILAALCVSDTFFLIHCLIFTGLNVYKKLNPVEGEKINAYVYPYFGAYGSVVTARITSLLTTLLCAERFVAVFFPMQARTICSKRNTYIAIAAICIITLLSFVPFILKYHPVTSYIHENLTLTSMNTTSFYNNNLNFYKVYGTILNIVFRFAPLVIIPILNVIMIRVVHKTWKRRRSMSADNNILRLSSRNGKHCSSTDQNHITIMLLTVSFVFLICILPGALNSLATHIWCSYNRLGKLRNLYMVISTITFLLETINSSVNFIIYMALNKKFRLLYKEKFCCGHGQYYRKISLSSVKERFRWSSSKKQDKADSDSKFRRQTVSDIGPLVTDTLLQEMGNTRFNEIHSEGFNCRTGTTTVMLESCLSYNEKKTNIQNDKCHKERFDKSYFKNLFRRREKYETRLSIDIENGNSVACKIGACQKNKGLTNGPSNI